MSYTKQSILFISGLDKSISENTLYQLFNDYSISYIKIAKDHQTRESFGYAFVGFKNHAKADEAIKKLNYSKLAKKTLRITWYNREPNNYRSHPEYNIFVKKIDKKITAKEFHAHFEPYGRIVSAKLAEDDEGESMGYGFVLYDSEESAKKAIEACHDKEWNGKKLYVQQFIKNREKKPLRYNNVYVRNIPKEWTDNDIKTYFEKYGEIGSMLVKTPDPTKLKPEIPEEKKKQILAHKYAFVCYKSLDGPAKNAVNKVPYYKINDKEYNEKIDKIVELCKKHNVDEENLYKCACYIEENGLVDKMNNEEEAKKVISDFKNLMTQNDGVYLFKDKSNRLECCQALKKAEREKKLKQLYEKIKKKIKEKYKFCNLYVKNLPDDYTDEDLKKLFGKYGEIRSAKVVKKEMIQNYLSVKRLVKVFGFVCYFEAEKASEAKKMLHQKALLTNGPKLYVDYHQTKAERTEFLKLKLIRDSEKGKMPRVPPNVRFPFFPAPGMRYPMQMRPGPMPRPMMMPNPNMQPKISDPSAKADFYGEKLYAKISSIPDFKDYQFYFPKIVGIFIDLNDEVLNKLLNDDKYFIQQVKETINLLRNQEQQTQQQQ
jgi:polyadenylate-binding protein